VIGNLASFKQVGRHKSERMSNSILLPVSMRTWACFVEKSENITSTGTSNSVTLEIELTWGILESLKVKAEDCCVSVEVDNTQTFGSKMLDDNISLSST
jgi:hypothetical protein